MSSDLGEPRTRDSFAKARADSGSVGGQDIHHVVEQCPPGNTAEFMEDVLVPGGARLQNSIAAPAFGQPGGFLQFELLDQIPRKNLARECRSNEPFLYRTRASYRGDRQKLPHTIDDAFEWDNLVVMFDPDSDPNKFGQFANIFGVSRAGQVVWKAELPTSNTGDRYYKIAARDPLTAYSTLVIRCRIRRADGRTGGRADGPDHRQDVHKVVGTKRSRQTLRRNWSSTAFSWPPVSWGADGPYAWMMS